MNDQPDYRSLALQLKAEN
jgi:hypothetical protein